MQKIQEKIIESFIVHGIISSSQECLSIEEVSSGYTNYAYIIRTKNQGFFCKYSKSKTKINYTEGKVRKRLFYEYSATKLVKKYTEISTPRIIFYDKKNSLLCFEEIPKGSVLLSDILLRGILPQKIGEK